MKRRSWGAVQPADDGGPIEDGTGGAVVPFDRSGVMVGRRHRDRALGRCGRGVVRLRSGLCRDVGSRRRRCGRRGVVGPRLGRGERRRAPGVTVWAVRPTAVVAAAHRPRRAGVTSREGEAVGDHRVKVEVISVRCRLVGPSGTPYPGMIRQPSARDDAQVPVRGVERRPGHPGRRRRCPRSGRRSGRRGRCPARR